MAHLHLLGNSRYELMMGIYADVATLFAVSRLVTVVDEQYRDGLATAELRQ
jgi:hypothetical protein